MELHCAKNLKNVAYDDSQPFVSLLDIVNEGGHLMETTPQRRNAVVNHVSNCTVAVDDITDFFDMEMCEEFVENASACMSKIATVGHMKELGRLIEFVSYNSKAISALNRMKKWINRHSRLARSISPATISTVRTDRLLPSISSLYERDDDAGLGAISARQTEGCIRVGDAHRMYVTGKFEVPIVGMLNLKLPQKEFKGVISKSRPHELLGMSQYVEEDILRKNRKLRDPYVPWDGKSPCSHAFVTPSASVYIKPGLKYPAKAILSAIQWREEAMDRVVVVNQATKVPLLKEYYYALAFGEPAPLFVHKFSGKQVFNRDVFHTCFKPVVQRAFTLSKLSFYEEFETFCSQMASLPAPSMLDNVISHFKKRCIMISPSRQVIPTVVSSDSGEDEGDDDDESPQIHFVESRIQKVPIVAPPTVPSEIKSENKEGKSNQYAVSFMRSFGLESKLGASEGGSGCSDKSSRPDEKDLMSDHSPIAVRDEMEDDSRIPWPRVATIDDITGWKIREKDMSTRSCAEALASIQKRDLGRDTGAHICQQSFGVLSYFKLKGCPKGGKPGIASDDLKRHLMLDGGPVLMGKLNNTTFLLPGVLVVSVCTPMKVDTGQSLVEIPIEGSCRAGVYITHKNGRYEGGRILAVDGAKFICASLFYGNLCSVVSSLSLYMCVRTTDDCHVSHRISRIIHSASYRESLIKYNET